jgi:Domain of unknown function (DUF5655)
MPRPLNRDQSVSSREQKEMWQCPKCGARFVASNMWHSCGRFRLDDHFIGKAPAVRHAFDRLREIIEECGAVEMIPQKTRIVFLARMRFVAAMPRRNWLEGHLNLARRVRDPRLFKIVRYGPNTYTHSFRAADASFFDKSFAALIRESYIRGRQAHRPTKPR